MEFPLGISSCGGEDGGEEMGEEMVSPGSLLGFLCIFV